MNPEFFNKMPMPHCDQTILHAPGKCEYCDLYPEHQALREWWNINFTNEHDPDKAPCPSTYRRTDEVRDRWYGNIERPLPGRHKAIVSSAQLDVEDSYR